jgi:hypothetical protein
MTPRTAYCDPPDIPEGMTIAEYRRTRARPHRSRSGLLRRALMRARVRRRSRS